MIRARKLLAAAALAGVSTACTSRHSAAPTTTQRVAPTTTVDIHTLAARYLAVWTPFHDKLAALRAQLTADAGDFAKTRSDYTRAAGAYRSFNAGVTTLPFGPALVSDSKALMKEGKLYVLYLDGAGLSTTPTELAQNIRRTDIEAPVFGQAEATLRRDLGLPPVVPGG